MTRIAAILGFTLLWAGSAFAADAYLCLPDAATGFSYNAVNKNWQVTQFNIQNDKYILKQKNGDWAWSDFGKEHSISCQAEAAVFLCELGRLTRVTVHRQSLRYQKIYAYGYIRSSNEPDSNSDTPFIEIGKCSPL